ncbi:hypothetical protein EN860_035190, partial [Mesorhizobium sp. M00.F.Ca.ET.217.01.1.1]
RREAVAWMDRASATDYAALGAMGMRHQGHGPGDDGGDRLQHAPMGCHHRIGAPEARPNGPTTHLSTLKPGLNPQEASNNPLHSIPVGTLPDCATGPQG